MSQKKIDPNGVIKAMMELHKQIENLARHPDRQNEAFDTITKDPRIEKNIRDDNPFSSILIDMGFDAAFTPMFPDALQALEVGDAVESYEMYQNEKNNSAPSEPPPPSAYAELEEEYLNDMARRITLERQYASLSSTLDEHENRATPTIKHTPNHM